VRGVAPHLNPEQEWDGYPLTTPVETVALSRDGSYEATVPAEWVEDVPDPLPPEPPDDSVLLDRAGYAYQRRGDRWYTTLSGESTYSLTWGDLQEDGPLTRLFPVPDPDDDGTARRLIKDAIAGSTLVGDEAFVCAILRNLRGDR
jgi:hypothetical protein